MFNGHHRKGADLTPFGMHFLDSSWNSNSPACELCDPSQATSLVLLSGFCFHAYEMVLMMHISMGHSED